MPTRRWFDQSTGAILPPREGGELSIEVLHRELFRISYAARMLDIAPTTLRRWVDGQENSAPVIRPEPTGSPFITWGEFVEARFLRVYRLERVPLARLRGFVSHLRESFGVPYPLAHFKPFIAAGPRLVLDAQNAAGIDAEHAIYVEATTGQLVLDGSVELLMKTVDYSRDDDCFAERIYPMGKRTPVVFDPEISSACPTVEGIRTEVLAELIAAGEDEDSVAEDYGLEVAQLRAALTFEWRHAAA